MGFEPTTLVLIGTDYINYLMVTTTTAREKMTVFAGELHVLLSTLVMDHLVKMMILLVSYMYYKLTSQEINNS